MNGDAGGSDWLIPLHSTLKSCEEGSRAQRIAALRDPLVRLIAVLATSAAFPEECDEWDQPQASSGISNSRVSGLFCPSTAAMNALTLM